MCDQWQTRILKFSEPTKSNIYLTKQGEVNRQVIKEGNYVSEGIRSEGVPTKYIILI